MIKVMEYILRLVGIEVGQSSQSSSLQRRMVSATLDKSDRVVARQWMGR